MPSPNTKSVFLSAINRMRDLCVTRHAELPNVQADRHRQMRHFFSLALETARGFDNPAVASGLIRFEPLTYELDATAASSMDGESRTDLEDELELFIAQIDSMGMDELQRPNGDSA